MKVIDRVRSKFREVGIETAEAEDLARKMSLSILVLNAKKYVAEFEKLVEPLNWYFDRDFGALLLQEQSVNANSRVKKYMLGVAIKRAEWCATCATSGGEGLARAEHLKELRAELECN